MRDARSASGFCDDRIVGDRARQVVEREVEPGAVPDQRVDLRIGLGPRQIGIEVGEHDLRHRQAERARDLAGRPAPRSSARGPWPAPRNFSTYMPSSSASTMAGSDPPSRSGVTYRVTWMVRGWARRHCGMRPHGRALRRRWRPGVAHNRCHSGKRHEVCAAVSPAPFRCAARTVARDRAGGPARSGAHRRSRARRRAARWRRRRQRGDAVRRHARSASPPSAGTSRSSACWSNAAPDVNVADSFYGSRPDRLRAARAAVSTSRCICSSTAPRERSAC